jgi:hypothetical protein
MGPTPNLQVERFRVRDGHMASSRHDGNNGAFHIPLWPRDRVSPLLGTRGAPVTVVVIASDGMGWDHVSVSLKDRCPTWEEMCLVKDLAAELTITPSQLWPFAASRPANVSASKVSLTITRWFLIAASPLLMARATRR